MSVFARASWAFWFHPVLLPDCRSALPLLPTEVGQAIDAVTGTRLGGFVFSSLGMFLSYAVVAIALGSLSSAAAAQSELDADSAYRQSLSPFEP
jgi:hypothetical protein